MENTTSPSCPEGWKESKFDFYQLRGVFDNLNSFSVYFVFRIVHCNFVAYRNVFIVFFSNSFNLNSEI